MVYDNIEFFNIAEIRSGVLYRFPRYVCEKLNIPEYDGDGRFLRMYNGHIVSARASCGVELRFVTAARSCRLNIRTDEQVRVTAYNGDFFLSSQMVGKGENSLEFSRLAATDGVDNGSRNRFSPDVWRICVDGGGDICYKGLEVGNGFSVRPPTEDEVPSYRLLAYGSSITQGSGTPYPTLNYLGTAAQILGVDILNKAVAGGCFCEKETVEYLCGERFDAAYLEAGTNIADRPLSVIRERIGYLIKAFCTRFPDKKIFLMTPVRGLSDVSVTALDYRQYYANTRKVITELAAEYSNAVLLDGHKLLNRGYYLGADILHPSDFGHVMMGVNFAKMLSPYFSDRSVR